MNDNIIILIPALNPDDRLISYVNELIDVGFSKIVVVNDGSTKNTDIFKKLSLNCKILTHVVNMGKGRALKTGINYILNHYSTDEIVGIITADSDGQHSVKDTLEVANQLKCGHQVVLGCRNFTGSDVPFKSKFGNNLTMYLFAFLYGKRISDTQTGLRGLSYDILRECLTYTGERYEYEMHMLIETVTTDKDIVEVPIETIYYDGNKESHFSVVKDSIRIYKVLLARGIKYILSSLCGFVVDIVLFTVIATALLPILSVSKAILISTVGARVASAVTNYVINRNVVFKDGDRILQSGFRYFILVIVQLLCSWILVTFLYANIKWNATILKVIVDTCLFLVSYKIQHRWIFSQKRDN